MRDMHNLTYIILCTCLLLSNTSCIHTSKITNIYNNGAQLKATDVVLFAGFNNAHSQTSVIMHGQTERILKKYGIKSHYIQTTDFNYEFLKAGFPATSVDLENPKFLYQLAEVYGITHIFKVVDIKQYQGDNLPVSRDDQFHDQSGVIFEVYAVNEDEVIASMHLSGNTLHFVSINEPEDRTYGNIFKNYGKGLRKLMKASKY